LKALYQDDVEDMLDFLNIKHDHLPFWRPLLRETSAVLAGYGLRLCEHYKTPPLCEAEMANMTDLAIYSIHYDRNSLTVSLAEVTSAYYLWEPSYRHIEDFSLGSNNRYNNPGEQYYWEAVRDKLREPLIKLEDLPRPEMIFLSGDQVEDMVFKQIFRESLLSVMNPLPPIADCHPEFMAARGAAEFQKRRQYSDYSQTGIL
jgi:hypothetical protein